MVDKKWELVWEEVAVPGGAELEATWSTWAEMEADIADQQKKDDLAKAEWERNSEELSILRATQSLVRKADVRLEGKKYRERLYGGNNVENDNEWRSAWLKYVCRDQ